MAIDFIFVASIFTIILIILSFYFRNEVIVQIASLAMMILGVSVLISGIGGIYNLMTTAYGIIFVCFGFYILIKTQIEYIEENI